MPVSLALRPPPVAGVWLLFALQPVLLGNLLVRLPDIKENAGLDKAELGLALVGLPLASMATMFIIAVVLRGHVSTRHLLLAGYALYGCCVVPVGLASSLPQLFMLGVGIGISFGLTEIGLNVHASDTEKIVGRRIMSRTHGFWTLGELSGGALGVALGALEVGVFAGLLGCAVITLPVALLIVRGLPAVSDTQHAEEFSPPPRIRIGRVLLCLGVFLICMAMVEGIGSDWSTLFLQEHAGWSTAAAGSVYLTFIGSLCVARFAGDIMVERWGPVRLMRFLVGLCIVGLVLIAGRFHLALIYAGFVCLGFGVSIGFPLTMTAAGLVPTNPPKSNIAFVSVMASFSFLIGPPAIGYVGEAFGLHYSYAMMIPVMLVAFACTFALNPDRHPPGQESRQPSPPGETAARQEA